MKAVSTSTLGEYAADGYRYNVWCRKCQRGALVDPGPLVERLGADHPIDIKYKLKCAKCGGKDIELRMQPPAPKIVR